MVRLFLFFGPHEEEDFRDLEPILKKKIEALLAENRNKFLIIQEYGGPPYTFERGRGFPSLEDIKKAALNDRENIPTFIKSFNEKGIVASGNPFVRKYLEFMKQYRPLLFVEEIDLDELLRLATQYQQHPDLDGSRDAEARDKIFWKQIKDLMEMHPDREIIVVRGSTHKNTLEKRLREAGIEFESETYGTPFETAVSELFSKYFFSTKKTMSGNISS